jgi:hypothetical protein
MKLMPIKERNIINCEKRIQPLLFPKTPNTGMEYLSTNGAHKNFNEYVRTNHAKKPISVKEIPTSLSHAVSVEKTSMYGRPEAKPNNKIPKNFLLIT